MITSDKNNLLSCHSLNDTISISIRKNRDDEDEIIGYAIYIKSLIDYHDISYETFSTKEEAKKRMTEIHQILLNQ